MKLDTLIQSTQRNIRRQIRLHRALDAITFVLIAIFACFIIDAVWHTGVTMRFMLICLTGVVGLMSVYHLRLPRTHRQPTPQRFALLAERESNLHTNQLINALQIRAAIKKQNTPGVIGISPFTGTAHTDPDNNPQIINAGTTLRNTLAELAIKAGEQAANSIQSPPTSMEHRRQLRQSFLWFLICTLCIGVSCIICPQLPASTIPRFADPLGDHPAFSWVTSHITFSPDLNDIIAGEDLHITLDLQGWGADKTDNVSLVGTFTETQEHITIPLEPSKTGWMCTLPNLSKPLTFLITYGRTRTHQYKINPLPIPRVVYTSILAGEPAYAAITPWIITNATTPFVIHEGGWFEVEMVTSLPIKDVSITSADNTILSDIQTQFTRRDDRMGGFIRVSDLALGDQIFHLTPVGIDGTFARQPIEIGVEVLPDAPPAIVFREPAMNAASLSDATIPLVLNVDDDLGIINAELILSVNDNASTRIALPSATDNTIYYDLDLSQFQLQPDDVLMYIAVCLDNRPDHLGGPQTGTSNEYEVLIIDKSSWDLLASPHSASDSDHESDETSPDDSIKSSDISDADKSQSTDNDTDASDINHNPEHNSNVESETIGDRPPADASWQPDRDMNDNMQTNASGDDDPSTAAESNTSSQSNKEGAAASGQSSATNNTVQPTADNDNDRLLLEEQSIALQEQLKDRVVFGPDSQIWSSDTTSQEMQDGVDVSNSDNNTPYETMLNNNRIRTIFSANAATDDPASPVAGLESTGGQPLALRSIPLEYRDLVKSYFQSLALAESVDNQVQDNNTETGQ